MGVVVLSSALLLFRFVRYVAMSDPQELSEDPHETVNDHLQITDSTERSDEEDGASSYRSVSRSPEPGELYYGGEEEEEVPVELGRAIAVSLLVYRKCIDCL